MEMDKAIDNEIQQLGRRIKELRMQRGLKQSQLAEQIGISQTNLSNIERGRTSVTMQNLFKIRSVLNCRMTDFFTDEGSSSGSLQLNDAVQILRLLKNVEIKGL